MGRTVSVAKWIVVPFVLVNLNTSVCHPVADPNVFSTRTVNPLWLASTKNVEILALESAVRMPNAA